MAAKSIERAITVFGPVPSRRLGKSLGINNIPSKICSYSCAYCQVGRTWRAQTERGAFYPPEQILKDVRQRLAKLKQREETVDYLCFVPDGEPTLDLYLGRTLELLRPLRVRRAVITNGSLLAREDVRQDLSKADWVSLKVDSVVERLWRRINRPHQSLQLGQILEGMLALSRSLTSRLVTETMLVAGVNEGEESLAATAAFLGRLKPARAYLSIPTRPPADKWVHPPDAQTVTRAYRIYRKHLAEVELLVGYEGNAFVGSGDPEEDLLGITAVHPMREQAVRQFMGRLGASWAVVQKLMKRGDLVQTEYDGHRYYLRAFSAPNVHEGGRR